MSPSPATGARLPNPDQLSDRPSLTRRSWDPAENSGFSRMRLGSRQALHTPLTYIALSLHGVGAGKQIHSALSRPLVVLLVSEACDVEWTRRRLAAHVIGMHLHLTWITRQSDCDEAGLNILFHSAADRA